ncbi:hypothetical protein [Thermosulfuriphilus sp.]
MAREKRFPEILEAFPRGLERNAYFYGKLLTVRDFITEQRYFRAKHQLCHHSLHGLGIVWGLEVRDFRVVEGTMRFKISPGLALDAQGREIIVQSDDDSLVVNLTLPQGAKHLGLFVRIKDCPEEPTPSACDPQECPNNRVREVYEFILTPIPQDEAGWQDLIWEGLVPLVALKEQGGRWQKDQSFSPPMVASLPEIAEETERLSRAFEALKEEVARLKETLKEDLGAIKRKLDSLSQRVIRLERTHQIHLIYLSAQNKWQTTIRHGFGRFPAVDCYILVPQAVVIAPDGTGRGEINSLLKGKNIEGGVMGFEPISKVIGPASPEAESTPPPSRRRPSALLTTVARPRMTLAALPLDLSLKEAIRRAKEIPIIAHPSVPEDKTLAELEGGGYKAALAYQPVKNHQLLETLTVIHPLPGSVLIKMAVRENIRAIRMMVILDGQ